MTEIMLSSQTNKRKSERQSVIINDANAKLVNEKKNQMYHLFK